MTSKTIATALAVACSALVASCGGGGGDGNSDVTIYGTCGNTPNYRSELGEFSRWKRFPITVGLDFSAAPSFSDPNIASIYLRALQAGASGWNVGNGIGGFSFVVGRNADIVIEFDPNFGASQLLGLTVSQYNGSYKTGLTRIYLNAVYFRDVLANAPLANFERRLQEIVQHEMGHALFSSSASGGSGTQGHSLDSRDVMANGGNGGIALSQRDINSIREAYCRAL